MLDGTSPCQVPGVACEAPYRRLRFDGEGNVLAVAPVKNLGPVCSIATSHDGRTGALLWTRALPYPTGSGATVTVAGPSGDLLVQLSTGASTTLQMLTTGPVFAWPHEWLAPAEAGSSYRFDVGPGGADGRVRVRVEAGHLPPGLRLQKDTGVISGIPARPGSWRFTLRVSDRRGRSSGKTFLIDVLGPRGNFKAELPHLSLVQPTDLYSPLRCTQY